MDVGAEVVNMDLIYGPELRLIPEDRRSLRDYLPKSSVLSKIFSKVPWIPKILVTRVAKEMLVSWQHPEGALFNKGAILVNASGERFTDETQSPGREIGVAKQPGKIAFLVFDHRVAQQFSAWPNFISTAPGIAYAYLQDYKRFRPDIFFEGQSWEDLARRLPMHREILKRTIAHYNRAVAGEEKDPWGREVFGSPLAEPPFFVLGPVKAYVPTTKGGLKVNLDFQVISKEGKVIPGLYAAGQTGIGGLILSSHGTGLAWAFTSGRLAGSHAVEKG
jgi:fumarate reductase flavoprotein subunit